MAITAAPTKPAGKAFTYKGLVDYEPRALDASEYQPLCKIMHATQKRVKAGFDG
jgi:hypothetical protein